MGRRTEETVAVEAGASMATFFFDEGFFSPSRFRFLLLRSDIVSAFCRLGRLSLSDLGLELMLKWDISAPKKFGYRAAGNQQPGFLRAGGETWNTNPTLPVRSELRHDGSREKRAAGAPSVNASSPTNG